MTIRRHCDAANCPRRTARGFTLVEVLVALAIVVVGLAALATTANQSARTTTYLRDRTLAQWIALNKITETRVSNTLPADDTTEGELEYANRRWRWELEKIPTPVEGISRLEARVALEEAREGSWLGQATGFMGAAINPASLNPPPPWIGSQNTPGGTPGANPGGPSQPGTNPPGQPPTPPGGAEPEQ